MFGLGKDKSPAKATAVPVVPEKPRSTEMKCTYCGGTKFFEGPSGGMSTNVLCSNEQCRHWFNYTPGLFFEDLHRVEPTKEEYEQKARDKKAVELSGQEARFAEGAKAYKEGKPLRSLMTDKTNYNYPPLWNFERLIGYTEAMQQDLDHLLTSSKPLLHPRAYGEI